MPTDLLLVEDNRLVTDALTILLESVGHQVRVAATVAEAIACGTEQAPALMLLDLTLPDGEGLDALAALRALGRAPRITIALTGHDEPEVVARCRDAGCAEVLLKPVSARQLIARVAAWEARLFGDSDGDALRGAG